MTAETSGWVVGLAGWRVLSGYLAGCGAAAATIATYVAMREVLFRSDTLAEVVSVVLAAVPGLLIAFVAILILSVPTFALFRALMHLLGRTDWVSFAVLGAINAYGLVSLLMGADTLELYLQYPPDPAIAVAGAVGGVACWRAERHLAGCPA
ncbi:hypothetical protein LHP98_05390 [Rhodobacter sp. Har01]|uniref:hypothetical protein n=1 Tax=Rhodobacter sp. Har01 TaxID=2883999 RepID=UPI001D06FCAC|nr:hypothetical protein [Rhodobacter sp. Har01]MCB6177563.1 hypothetical protein [Rhodobacter sp. Har01]